MLEMKHLRVNELFLNKSDRFVELEAATVLLRSPPEWEIDGRVFNRIPGSV